MKTSVAAIVGPTAVGKTEVSVTVAERLGAEIVSIDSMQIYRGMDVGTAKPDEELRKRIPHHLIDIRDPSEAVTVAEFQSLARAAITQIADKGRLPLLVGGSGLYFRAVVDELEFPPHAPKVRAALEAEVEAMGPEALHARLQEIDPAAAARIEPGNARRTVRALEVIEATGRLFSLNDSWDRYESIFELKVAGLSLDRERLYARIAERVDRMFDFGLEAEVKRLADDLGATACMALGYRQVLDDGASARDEIVRATKRFARRQESWFRADPRIHWFDAERSDLADAVVEFFESHPQRLT